MKNDLALLHQVDWQNECLSFPMPALLGSYVPRKQEHYQKYVQPMLLLHHWLTLQLSLRAIGLLKFVRLVLNTFAIRPIAPF